MLTTKVHVILLQKEFFQDDLFPETAVLWESALRAAAWLSGSDGQHRKISMQPKDMTPGTAAHSIHRRLQYVHTGSFGLNFFFFFIWF